MERKNALPGSFGLSRYYCNENKSTFFRSQTSVHLKLLSTLVKEVEPVVLVLYEFDYRVKTRKELFSSEDSDYEDTDAREKNPTLFK